MDSIVMLAIKLDILYSEIAQLPYFCRMDGKLLHQEIMVFTIVVLQIIPLLHVPQLQIKPCNKTLCL